MEKQYQTNHLGIVYGPYGHIGYTGTLQREDLNKVAQTFFGLFRWARKIVASFL